MKFIEKLDENTFIEYELSDADFSLKGFFSGLWYLIRVVGTFMIGMAIFCGRLCLLSLLFT